MATNPKQQACLELVVGACVVVAFGFVICSAAAAPPYHGTIFIDPDIITPDDPTTFESLSAGSQAKRKVFDRRVDRWIDVDAFVFDATFKRGRSVEFRVNPEFGGLETARREANRYAPVIGRLPNVLRKHLESVTIHRGQQLFGGGNKNIVIHTEQADLYTADGILEEALVHEATHTSLDEDHAKADGWREAQRADPDFISTYARDNPQREDVAESYLLYLAIRNRPDRLNNKASELIERTMPNRIKYFDAKRFDVDPITAADAPVARVQVEPNPPTGETQHAK